LHFPSHSATGGAEAGQIASERHYLSLNRLSDWRGWNTSHVRCGAAAACLNSLSDWGGWNNKRSRQLRERLVSIVSATGGAETAALAGKF